MTTLRDAPTTLTKPLARVLGDAFDEVVPGIFDEYEPTQGQYYLIALEVLAALRSDPEVLQAVAEALVTLDGYFMQDADHGDAAHLLHRLLGSTQP